MTGLDPDSDQILEIFCIITDGDLNALDDEGWGVVVNATPAKMDRMSDYVKQIHERSGLTTKVLASSVTAEAAADGLLAYIKTYVPDSGKALLAGSSVHYDKAFLRLGPYARVCDHLHHRILDVSSIKEAAKRWSPSRLLKKIPSKKGLHEARADILESIAEAEYYRTAIFKAS
jgi:oligoribonuclease